MKPRSLARAALAAGALAACAALPAASGASDPRLVKASFIYNFTKFVEWPSASFDGDRAPVVIGVTGRGELGEVLKGAVADRRVRGRGIEVRRLGSGAGAAQLRGCHLLVVEETDPERVAEILRSVRGASVLTVGAAADFAARGGMIGFREESGHMALDLNVGVAEAARLRISPKLKQLSRIVDTE